MRYYDIFTTEHKQMDINDIIRLVVSKTNIPSYKLMRTRNRTLALYRTFITAIAKWYTKMTYSEIAKALAYRHHSTMIQMYHKLLDEPWRQQEFIKMFPEFKEDLTNAINKYNHDK